MKRGARRKDPEHWRDMRKVNISQKKIRAQQQRTLITEGVNEPMAMMNELKMDLRKIHNKKTGKTELEIKISSVGKPLQQTFRGNTARKDYREKYLRHLRAAGNDYQSVLILVDSHGGSVDSAYGLLAALQEVLVSRISVTVLITGTCGSAATMILGGSWPVYIRPTARIYIHSSRRVVFRRRGSEWEETGRRAGSRWTWAVLYDIYKNRIRKWSKKKIPRRQIKAWMDGKWFSAEEAVEVGLCDGVWKY